MGIDAIGQVCEACIALIERVPEPMCQVCGIPLQPGSPPPFPDAAESTPGEAQRSRARQAEQSAAEQTSPRGAHIKKESNALNRRLILGGREQLRAIVPESAKMVRWSLL